MGLFDGLHRGHLTAVKELLKYPGEKTVYTFLSLSVDTKGDRRLLMSDGEKYSALCGMGVDRVITVDFRTVKDMPPGDFVNTVLTGLGAEKVICGENFHFGAGGKAGSQELKILCEKAGIAVETVPTVCDKGLPISTTRIRKLIERGDVREAVRLLGRPYTLPCSVHGGAVIFDPQRVIPADGHYKAAAGGIPFELTIKNGVGHTDIPLPEGLIEVRG